MCSRCREIKPPSILLRTSVPKHMLDSFFGLFRPGQCHERFAFQCANFVFSKGYAGVDVTAGDDHRDLRAGCNIVGRQVTFLMSLL